MTADDFRYSSHFLSALLLVSAGCGVDLLIEGAGPSGETPVPTSGSTAEPTGASGSTVTTSGSTAVMDGTSGGTTEASVEMTGTSGETAGTTVETDGDSGTGEPAECVPPIVEVAPWTHVSAGVGGGSHEFEAVALDAAGDIYAAGFSRGELMLPGMPAAITSAVTRPIVAKFDCAGDLLWITAGEASEESKSFAMMLGEDEQSVYVGGGSDGSLQFAGADPIGPGAYVLRLAAATGAVQAITTLAGDTKHVRALAIGEEEETVYAAGRCEALKKGGLLVAALPANLETAVVRCTFELEAKTTDALTAAWSIAVLADGDLVVGGGVTGSLEGRPIEASMNSAGFVARVATPLTAAPFSGEWFVPIGPSKSDVSRINAVAVLNDGTVIAGGKGYLLDETKFGVPICGTGTACDPAINNASVRAYAASFDPMTGVCQENRIFCSTGSTSEDLFALAPAADGLYAMGQYNGSLMIDGVTAAFAETGIRMFAARLTSGLTLEGGWMVSSEQDQDTDCVPADPDEPRSRVSGKAIAARGGDVAIAGSACGTTIRVGPQTFDTAIAQHHGFVGRLVAAP